MKRNPIWFYFNSKKHIEFYIQRFYELAKDNIFDYIMKQVLLFSLDVFKYLELLDNDKCKQIHDRLNNLNEYDINLIYDSYENIFYK